VFQHILLATDFSEASERAVELAAGLGRALRARVTVLHVYPSASATPPQLAAAARAWPGAIRAQARIDRTVDRVRARGVEADGMLRFGLLPERIVEVALELAADLIVVGTHGRKGLARMWYGSFAEEVLRESHIPVLAAVPHDRADDVPYARDNVIELRRR
jgi:nucleotide-binding universal stress UspA family protein